MDSSTAYVQVWGKGFRVSSDSEEFQRFVPRTVDGTEVSVEHVLRGIVDWGSILEPFYGMSEQELGSQQCLLLEGNEVLGVAAARSEDKHRRATILIVSVAASVNWEDEVQLADKVSRVDALSRRLAGAYAKQLRGAPERIGAQLRAGTFVANRCFDLQFEQPQPNAWKEFMHAVKDWRGVTGLATPRMTALGANVLIGTQPEAEKLGAAIAGFFDARQQLIVPVSGRLSRWHRENSPDTEVPSETPVTVVDARSEVVGHTEESEQSSVPAPPPAPPAQPSQDSPKRDSNLRSDPLLDVLSAIAESLRGLERMVERFVLGQNSPTKGKRRRR